MIIRFCMETPMTEGRVFEMGDEMLLQFAHMNQSACLGPHLLLFDRLLNPNQFPL